MNDQQEVLETLARLGAIISDSHIVYASGKHGPVYVNKDAIYPHTEVISDLCKSIAQEFSITIGDVDVVVGPVIGGVVLSQWVSWHLSNFLGHEVLAAFAEKEGRRDEDAFVLKRGYDQLVKGKKVLVVEDVLTTGGSARKVIEVVRANGGDVFGLGALCNRGGITSRDAGGPPWFFTILSVHLDAWDEAECPLCKAGVPINTDVGKGREFLAQKGK